MGELINQEDRRFIATAALPLLDQARTQIAGCRRTLIFHGLLFPVRATLWLFVVVFFLMSGGIEPMEDKTPRSKLKFYLAAIPLGASPPLLLVAGLLSALFDFGPMAGLNPSRILWGFLLLQVCIGVGFAALASQIWVSQLNMADGVWLELDKNIHELGLEDEFVLSFESGVELDEMTDKLAKLQVAMEQCADGSL
jgi:hypothetical protein